MKKNIIILLFSILVMSCNSDDNQFDIVDVETTLIAKDNLYGDGAEGIIEQNIVISDQSTWNDLLTKLNSINNVSDNFTETEIDFSEYRIIAVFDGVKETGGYSLELKLMSDSENIRVNITKLIPEENASSVITQPFHIVKIRKSDLPLIFELKPSLEE
ncbi:protease complex subunit PrcB family protein [Arenibacter algicola]|uniref:protease complex subunit PrcB family protein n=1 Tax=Arenibacter algicola TaxID=616991 RepID=UPI001C07D6C9|nr:protease complex subunit PrcB family protein [Arenibacter algicola]MBU2903899.1 protease complex subunit PrcB family protein [Arenibacter algicola]